jgi:hypothetical protein
MRGAPGDALTGQADDGGTHLPALVHENPLNGGKRVSRDPPQRAHPTTALEAAKASHLWKTWGRESSCRPIGGVRKNASDVVRAAAGYPQNLARLTGLLAGDPTAVADHRPECQVARIWPND